MTWNSEDSIAACVESVLKQTYADFDLLIVDNNSQDRTCDLISQYNDPRITLYRKKENTGFCGGHNFAINHSSSEFVLLVNPDIIMDQYYLENAMAAMLTEKRIGTVCGLLLQSNSSDPNCVVDSAGLSKKRSGIMRLNHHGENFHERTFKKSKVFGCDGALPLYRRTMIEDISHDGEFFDEMFFAHKEDWDVSWRAQIYGWETLFDPSCIAVHPRHFRPKSLIVRNSISIDIKVHSVKNQLILLLKNEAFLSFLINFIFIVPRQLAILLYIVVFETSSLAAYRMVIRNMKPIMTKRKIIQGRRVK